MESKSRCLECSWMGSVVYKPCDKCAQHAADAELGRMVRELAEKRRNVIIGASVIGGWICRVGLAEKKPTYAADTLDEAVRKALERGT